MLKKCIWPFICKGEKIFFNFTEAPRRRLRFFNADGWQKGLRYRSGLLRALQPYHMSRVVFLSGGGFLQTSSKNLTRVEWAQVVHYMRATGTPYGLLINFGRPQFQYDTFDKESLSKIFG